MIKRGQVWVETVMYTLIGLAILGSLIAVMTPRIQKISDNALITQSINSLNKINEQIGEVLMYSGTQREIILAVKNGEYIIDSINNSIEFVLSDTKLKYSEIGENVPKGYINVLTTQRTNNNYDVTLSLNYSAYNLSYQDADKNKILTGAPNPYKLLVQNNGPDSSDKQIINIEII